MQFYLRCLKYSVKTVADSSWLFHLVAQTTSHQCRGSGLSTVLHTGYMTSELLSPNKLLIEIQLRPLRNSLINLSVKQIDNCFYKWNLYRTVIDNLIKNHFEEEKVPYSKTFVVVMAMNHRDKCLKIQWWNILEVWRYLTEMPKV